MPKVVFQGNDEDAQVGEELADVTRRAGWPIAYGCEDGMCGTCIIETTKGAENLTKMSDKEEQTLDIMCMNDGNHRLACQCKVQGDVEMEQP